jgi:hypothetical protein
VLDDSAVGACSYAATGPIRPTNRPWESGVPARVSARAGLSVSWAGDAQQGQGPGGVAGVVAQRGSDVAAAVETQDADGQVAQAGHGPGGGAGADLAGVLGEGGVADVVQRLDAAAVAGMVGDGDLASGQGNQLVVQRGLVGLDEPQVGGVLDGDQPLGVLALGVQCVGGLGHCWSRPTTIRLPPLMRGPASSGSPEVTRIGQRSECYSFTRSDLLTSGAEQGTYGCVVPGGRDRV